jgi:hypothetical protein
MYYFFYVVLFLHDLSQSFIHSMYIEIYIIPPLIHVSMLTYTIKWVGQIATDSFTINLIFFSLQ